MSAAVISDKQISSSVPCRSCATETQGSPDPQQPSRLGNDPVTILEHAGFLQAYRVIKSGYVERRTQKTKKWKLVYMVLRPTTLSIYKDDKEAKLRHQIYLSDLTAVSFLKDPKQKRENLFGLFSPSKDFHLQAPTLRDVCEWVDLIGKHMATGSEEDISLAGLSARGLPPSSPRNVPAVRLDDGHIIHNEQLEPSWIYESRDSQKVRPPSLTGGEAGSSLDASVEKSAVRSEDSDTKLRKDLATRPSLGPIRQRIINHDNTEPDPDRVIWHGWLWLLRSKGGVRQWKNMWAVLRPRNLILYKDEFEYTAQWIAQLSAVIDIVDIDPLGRNKKNCLQVITEEKSFRFCAHDEESLVQFVGAFKSLLAKRPGSDHPAVLQMLDHR